MNLPIIMLGKHQVRTPLTLTFVWDLESSKKLGREGGKLSIWIIMLLDTTELLVTSLWKGPSCIDKTWEIIDSHMRAASSSSRGGVVPTSIVHGNGKFVIRKLRNWEATNFFHPAPSSTKVWRTNCISSSRIGAQIKGDKRNFARHSHRFWFDFSSRDHRQRGVMTLVSRISRVEF